MTKLFAIFIFLLSQPAFADQMNCTGVETIAVSGQPKTTTTKQFSMTYIVLNQQGTAIVTYVDGLGAHGGSPLEETAPVKPDGDLQIGAIFNSKTGAVKISIYAGEYTPYEFKGTCKK